MYIYFIWYKYFCLLLFRIYMLNTTRYNRQIILPEIGEVGQAKLNAAKVLVVGAGGLGCPVLQYLAGAGVGTIGVIDHDIIDESNLQRQILFKQTDVGKSKALTAKSNLELLNPHISVIAYNEALNHLNAKSIFSNYDLVIDGTDNFATRYLVNDTCVIQNIPFIAASILKFEGQISVYNYQNGPTYRCLFPEPPLDALTCAEAGVLGVLGGIMGSLQANEAIKIITGIGEVLSGKLFVINALNLNNYTLNFERSINYKDINEADYIENCKIDQKNTIEISPIELKENIKDFSIIDLRIKSEYNRLNIGGINLEPENVQQFINSISDTKKIVLCCNYGNQSLILTKSIFNNNKNIYSLKGGLNAYFAL